MSTKYFTAATGMGGMSNENRAHDHVCPACTTHPVVREDGDLFCDLCNRFLLCAVPPN